MAENTENTPLSFEQTWELIRKDKKNLNPLTIAGETKNLIIQRVQCGIPELDFQLGGGIPVGRGIHIYGPRHSGKTFVAMRMTAALQQAFPEKRAMWLDFEHSQELNRMEAVGVDSSRLLISQPITAEDALNQAIIMMPHISALVIDSVAAINATCETEGDMADQQVAAISKVMSKFYRLWLTAVAKEQYDGIIPTIILCNQERDSLKAYTRARRIGGNSVEHNVSIEMETKRGDRVELKAVDPEGNPIIVGHMIKFVIPKNNTFQPDKSGQFLLCTRPTMEPYPMMPHQVDWARGLVKYAVYYEVMQKSGSWHSVGDRKWQGNIAAQKAVFEDPDLALELNSGIIKEIRRRYGIKDRNEEVAKAGKASGRKFERKATTGERK